jgi:proteic killer suppression protein
MIRGYQDECTQDLFNGGHGHHNWQAFIRVARIKLLMLHAAGSLRDLVNAPRNELQPVNSDRAGQHFVTVNGQYKLSFIWQEGHAYSVEIVDCTG